MHHDDQSGDDPSADDRGGRRSGSSSSDGPGGRPGDVFGDLLGARLRDALRGGRPGGGRGHGSGGGFGAGPGTGSALFERIVDDVSSWFDDERGDGRRAGRSGRSGTAGTGDASRRPARGAPSGRGDGERDSDATTRDADAAGTGAPVAPADDYDDEGRAALHRGHGPKGYRRGDERLVEIVNDALCEAGDLDARGIAVSAKKGDVKLAGRVPTRRQKHRAENLAARAAGVRDVDNRLRVRRERDAGGAGAGSTGGEGQLGGTPGEAARDDDDYGHPR